MKIIDLIGRVMGESPSLSELDLCFRVFTLYSGGNFITANESRRKSVMKRVKDICENPESYPNTIRAGQRILDEFIKSDKQNTE